MAATITRKLVSLTDAAEILAVSTKTVRRYIADGHLEAVRLGRKTLRIKLDSIERFIDARPVGGWRRAGKVSRACPEGPAGCSSHVPRKQAEALERDSDLRFLCGRYWV